VVNIVVLDDDSVLADVVARELSSRRRQVQAFSDPIRALAALATRRADLLITDLSMPWVDGKDVVQAARQRQPDLKVLLMSGYARGAEIASAERVGFLRKPIDLDGLLSAVDQALAARDPS
jgi:two-component system response regulator GlrR